MLALNDLFDYPNRMIYQDTNYFKFSLDSILLSEFAEAKDSDKVLDLCAGNMAVALMMSTRTNANFYGFEIQKSVYDLGIKSIEFNKLNDKLTLINDNINNIKNYFDSEYFDVMVCNPPYFKENEAIVNLSIEKKIARHELYLKLEDIFSLAKTYLKNKGALYLVHRAIRLDEIIYLSVKYGIRAKNIQFISTKNDIDPEIVLIKFIKNAGQGVKINKNITIEGKSTYQNMFREEI